MSRRLCLEVLIIVTQLHVYLSTALIYDITIGPGQGTVGTSDIVGGGKIE